MKSNIGELIEERGYMKKYIAKQLEITPNQLSNWISGKSHPTMEKAFKLADLLNVKVDDLYDRTEQE
ncbi:helix-turn-helix transcriptional regulator [Cytobacillus oceanisediminis]|uniref:DNA-binding XRE family transcriptional regulator n=1 Tax=Cytobacillus oceanisediminis TaxID=665099 RepID=A0A562JCU4_9BACI|nr:helix-turn-helix transcriptional regulator [Cytobacillus oceanisediminis]TWH80981.1 DNA-binding XRE family transcriptional regulator [Cytobacillus oceanisediminis]